MVGQVCSLLRPNAETAVYSMPMGGTIDQAASSTGQRYADLPNALKLQQAVSTDCTCRRAGQNWASALAAAEARYSHGLHDILMTQGTSDRMSRLVVDPKLKLATASLAATTVRVAVAPAQRDPGMNAMASIRDWRPRPPQ